MNKSIESRIIVLFGGIIVLLAITTIAALRNISSSTAGSDWVNHTHAVIFEADGILSAINSGEKGLRDFVLTGNERDRNICRRAYAEAAEHLTVGKALTRSEPTQNQEFLRLEDLVAQRVSFAREVMKARVEHDFESARQILSRDKDETSEIEQKVQTLRSQEEDLLRGRDKESYLQTQNTRWIVFAGLGLNVAIIAFIVFLIRDDLEAHRRAAAILQDSNLQLEGRVRERTRELAEANTGLAEQILEQRWSNQALDHQLRYNQLIINSIDSLVLVVSRALNITRLNPAITRRTGFEAAELIGKPLREVLEIEDPSGTDLVASCMRDGRDLTNARGVLKERVRPKTVVRFSVFPIRDRDRIVGGVVTIILIEESKSIGLGV